MSDTPQLLLAVDAGLRTGLALFAAPGQLLWYRSHHVPNHKGLRGLIGRTLSDIGPDLAFVFVEGDRTIGETWETAASRFQAKTHIVHAEQWRRDLLRSRERKNGPEAKKHAIKLAAKAIDALEAKKPKSGQLRHDTAEAILMGLWALGQVEWTQEPARLIRG